MFNIVRKCEYVYVCEWFLWRVTDTADCVMYPCYNGGTCVVTSSTVNRCQCGSNYNGLLCQTPVT